MGLWSAYFFAKFLLYAGGYIGFSPWLNLLFATLTALPTLNARQRFAKNLLAVPLGIMLLYHDSWFPPITRVLSQTQDLASFTLPFLLELLSRFIDWRVLAALAAMLAAYAIARRRLRMSTFVFVGIFVIMLLPQGTPDIQSFARSNVALTTTAPKAAVDTDPRNMRHDALDELLTKFYARERARQVHFPSAVQGDSAYDIVILHACSLSWDDLEIANRTDDPLLQRFDILFSAFNSAASYSGPAAIRLLRGNCGLTPHQQLYEPTRPECLVFDGLQDAGFEPQWLMNHDGQFGDFFADVSERGAFPTPPQAPPSDLVAQRSFDGSPVYDDYSTLSRWWNQRLSNPAPRVALYYNTISLHDGNRMERSGVDSSFAARMAQFTSDLGRFLDDLQRSGRRVIVIILPEHGAAVRGDRRQIPGLREIPTPAITNVPVGIVLVNAPRLPDHTQQRVDVPTSYLALNELLSRFLADDPFAKPLSLATYVRDLPRTETVAENEGTVMMQIGGYYMMRTPDGEWSTWGPAQKAQ